MDTSQISSHDTVNKRDVTQPRSSIGVLLVHGLNGTIRDMDELEKLLMTHGMQTENLLLPGHGTHVRDMLPIGWPEWSAEVRNAIQNLSKRCDKVFLVGHSLGGSLCLHAATKEPIAGIVTLCAPITMFPGMLHAVRLLRCITPVLPTLREDVRDREARRLYRRNVYRWTPMAPVESMLQYLPLLRKELPYVTAPILVMAAIHDHVVPVRDGRTIYHLVGSQDKHIIHLRRSYHVVMKDHDREEVFAQTLAFIQHHTA